MKVLAVYTMDMSVPHILACRLSQAFSGGGEKAWLNTCTQIVHIAAYTVIHSELGRTSHKPPTHPVHEDCVVSKLGKHSCAPLQHKIVYSLRN